MAHNSPLNYRSLWLFLGIIYIGLILLGSLSKVPELNLQLSYSDKIIHFLMYFILVGWFMQLYHKRVHQLLILLGAVLLGLIIEFIQGMTTYRSFEYIDEIANSIGAICAFLFANTFFNAIICRIDLWIYKKVSQSIS